MKQLFIGLFTLAFLTASLGGAKANSIDGINHQSIKDAGFEKVGEILENMSLKQREQVLKQAESMMGDLKDMSPKEIEDFTQKLLSMENSLDISTINAKSLDISKTKGLVDIQKDIDGYLSR